jgi:hypothetical protein
MSSVGIETTISAGERPQTYALGRAATGIDKFTIIICSYYLHAQIIYNYIAAMYNGTGIYNVAGILWLQYIIQVMIFHTITFCRCTSVLHELSTQSRMWLFLVVT